MSLGLMNKKAQIIDVIKEIDSFGFASKRNVVLADIRVYVENKHANEKWSNLASFSEATDLFRFRKIPLLILKTSHYILFKNNLYNILSIEDIKGRGMYIEVLAKKVESSNG